MENFGPYFGLILLALILYYYNKGRPKAIKEVKTFKFSLSDEEKQIRSNWLHSMKVFLIGNFIMNLVTHSFFAYTVNIEVANEFLMIGIVAYIPLGIGACVIYSFAYLEFGTKWLAWILIASPLRTAYDIITGINEIYKEDYQTFFVYYILGLYFISTALFVYFWIHNKRLYNLNCKMQTSKRYTQVTL